MEQNTYVIHAPLIRSDFFQQGNISFRQLGAKYRKEYLCTKKSKKHDLIGRIVHYVRQGHGRFLQRDTTASSSSSAAANVSIFYEIGDERAYAKLSQMMREGSSIASLCRKIATKEKEQDKGSGGDGRANETLAAKLENINQKILLKKQKKEHEQKREREG